MSSRGCSEDAFCTLGVEMIESALEPNFSASSLGLILYL